jgi:hypothetical protein
MRNKILKLAKNNPWFKRYLIDRIKSASEHEEYEVPLETKIRFRPTISTEEIIDAVKKNAKKGKVLILGKGRSKTRLYFVTRELRGWTVSDPKVPYPQSFGNNLDKAAAYFTKAWMNAY